jgi:Flp pilus assembly protein TadD
VVAVKDLWVDTAAGRLVRKATEDIARERFDSALRHAERAVGTNPELSEAHAIKALALMKLGKASPAEESLVEAVKLDASNAQAQRMLGWLYLATGRPQTGLDPLSTAAALEPNDQQGQVWLAEALYRVGRIPEAVVRLQAVLAADPSHPRANYQLGYAYLKLDRKTEALEAFRRSLSEVGDLDATAVRRIIQSLEAR